MSDSPPAPLGPAPLDAAPLSELSTDEQRQAEAWAFALDALTGDELSAAQQRSVHDDAFAADVQAAREEIALLALQEEPVEPSAAAAMRLQKALSEQGPFAPLLESLAKLADLSLEVMRGLLNDLTQKQHWEPGPGQTTIFHLDGGPATVGAVVGFVKIPAGECFPLHTHGGDERVIVMEGALLDDDGARTEVGELVFAPAGSTHEVRGADGAEVTFFVVVFKGVQVGDDFIGPDDPRL